MKNFKKLAVLVLTMVLFASCSKDDAPQPNPAPIAAAPTILDDWNWESSGFINASNQVTKEGIRDNGCPSKKDAFLFNQTGSFSATYFSSACENTFFYQETGTYSLNATQDVLTIGGNTTTATDWDGSYSIVSLTATTLELKRLPTNGQALRVNYYRFSRRN